MGDLVSKVFDTISNILPIHRWLDATTNALKGLIASLALLVILAGMITFSLSGDQRFIGLMAVVAIFAFIIIAIVAQTFYRSGLGLYDPYQQSLLRGRRYGTEGAPKSKATLVQEPAILGLQQANQPPPLPPGQASLPLANGGSENP